MRIYILLVAVLATSLVVPGPQQTPTRTIAITNVTVIDGRLFRRESLDALLEQVAKHAAER
jgi:hypothetical protein